MNIFAIANVVTMQCRRCYVGIPLNEFAIANVATTQRRRCYVGIPMNEFCNINALMVQRRRCYVGIPMNEFCNINALMVQRCRCYINIPMNEFVIANVLISQLGTSCSFDSPGLARNEPTPGQRSQGDSTPSVLSFFWESIVIARYLIADYVEKAQHLRRCSTHNIR